MLINYGHFVPGRRRRNERLDGAGRGGGSVGRDVAVAAEAAVVRGRDGLVRMRRSCRRRIVGSRRCGVCGGR